MITTITPAVYAGSQPRRLVWEATRAMFVFGGVAGGAAVGGLLGALGYMLPLRIGTGHDTTAIAALSTVAILLAMHEVALVRLPLPSAQRQVQARLRGRLPIALVALVYSLQLGAGFLTRITTRLLYLIATIVVVAGDPWIGAAIFGLFGAVRSAFTLGLAGNTSSIEQAISRADGVARGWPTIALISFYILVGTATIATGSLVGIAVDR